MKLFRVLLFALAAAAVPAADLDTIGVTLLRQVDPTLTGAAVNVAQVEAPAFADPTPGFEVNPAAVGQPISLFTWISDFGTNSTYPNAAGLESSHANTVGGNFYGVLTGAAPGVGHVDNYEAGHFFNELISAGTPVQDRVANQSFIFDPSFEVAVNTNYDNYAAQFGTIFVSGINGIDNVKPLCAPGTCYNGLGVGAYGAFNLPGPTSDGRCKPDIAAPDLAQAPNGAVSYATPYVAAAAAILVQAANRGDGGLNTVAATDLRTLKALLLNGTVKPTGWTNSATAPLDARFGAGLVNVFNSWMQLKGGLHPVSETTLANGSSHPPGTLTNNQPSAVGWDNVTITTSTSGAQDRINHYYFNLPGTNSFTLTATLVWNKQANRSAINDLDLFLYNTSNSNLVAASVSPADNVEHLFLPQLSPGRYDLQVLKRRTGQVTSGETYSLAFEMFSLKLNLALSNNNVVLSWPLAPTGFRLQSAASLTPPVIWTSVNSPVSVNTNTSRNVVSVPVGGANQFFRLLRPTGDFGF